MNPSKQPALPDGWHWSEQHRKGYRYVRDQQGQNQLEWLDPLVLQQFQIQRLHHLQAQQKKALNAYVQHAAAGEAGPSSSVADTASSGNYTLDKEPQHAQGHTRTDSAHHPAPSGHAQVPGGELEGEEEEEDDDDDDEEGDEENEEDEEDEDGDESDASVEHDNKQNKQLKAQRLQAPVDGDDDDDDEEDDDEVAGFENDQKATPSHTADDDKADEEDDDDEDEGDEDEDDEDDGEADVSDEEVESSTPGQPMQLPQAMTNQITSGMQALDIDLLSQAESALPDDANVIRGTPGNHELLDSSYEVQRNPRQFFQRGKVFSILYTEPAGSTTRDHEGVTVVRFGEFAYTSIRRFIVVKPRRGWCYACPIYTYGGRGTAKPGVNPSEHARVYYATTPPPNLLPGEYGATRRGEYGVKPWPIRIFPKDWGMRLDPASRCNFGMVYPIQYNVKVKDLGMVAPECLDMVRGYWLEEYDDE